MIPFDHDRPSSWPTQGSPLPPPTYAGPDQARTEPGPLPPHRAPRGPRRARQAALVGGVVGALVAAGVAFATVKLTKERTVTVLSPATASVPATAAAVTPGTAAPLVTTASGGLEIHSLIAKVEPSVVAIEVGMRDSSGTVQAVAAGSGVIISADGLLLTNAHVVNVTDQFGRTITDPVFTIKMNDGSVRSAKVLGAASDYDVALMRLTNTAGLSPITLGNSSAVQVGDEVVAIGNALDLGDAPTVTKGIVSALNRSLAESDTLTLHGLIQTDAPINHGNSGGALVDSQGRLIGINSAGIPDAQNIGFAIAIDTIKPLLADLQAGKSVSASPSAFLGVTVTQTPEGVGVTDVTEGSAAAAAGIQPNDVIIKVGATDISTLEELSTALRAITPGTVTSVEVRRASQTLTLTVTMGSRSN